jgi:hypothetical protein
MPGYSGTVLAAMSQVIYLMGQDGEILWITHSDKPMHRRAIRIPSGLEGVGQGMSITVQGRNVLIDKIATIDLAGATIWQFHPAATEPPPFSMGCTKIHAQTLYALVCSQSSKGLACGLRYLAGRSGKSHPSQNPSLDTAILELIAPVLEMVIKSSQNGDWARVLQTGLDLIGLGQGLTPSGDDFMGGLLFTVHHLSAAYPGKLQRDAASLEKFLARARSLTNPISFTILSDLACGHGPEPLHALIDGLLGEDSPGQLRSEAECLTRIGHTSGWDMLAGVVVGMQMAKTSVL